MNEENRQKLSKLAERAWANETLRNELLSDPTPVLQKDGIEIPKGFDVQVRSDKDSVSFNFVPQTTGIGGELPESALENITGGLTFVFKLVAVKTISWSGS